MHRISLYNDQVTWRAKAASKNNKIHLVGEPNIVYAFSGLWNNKFMTDIQN